MTSLIRLSFICALALATTLAYSSSPSSETTFKCIGEGTVQTGNSSLVPVYSQGFNASMEQASQTALENCQLSGAQNCTVVWCGSESIDRSEAFSN
jgi:hypothetical protein